MIVSAHTAVSSGMQVQHVEVETDITAALPTIIVVGLADKAITESRERIRAAIKQSGYEFPLGKITVNLAPADAVKSGSVLDVAIAVCILRHTRSITQDLGEKTLYLGELSLDGSLRPIKNILSICLWAREHGFDRIFLPSKNRHEAEVVSGITIIAIDTLAQLVDGLNGTTELSAIEPISLLDKIAEHDHSFPLDMAHVKGQTVAKRALEIAAAGGHNVMLMGSPGSGKTLLARTFTSILPSMSETEVIEASRIYSAAGLLPGGDLIYTRPFRSPHHSASHVALVGGTQSLRPGEISLAHRGVLFLDEFAEFSRETIEALRGPLEDGFVTISRAAGSAQYPAKFILVAAANPTPGGHFQDASNGARHSANTRYQAKFSGPIMDRIDLHVRVEAVKTDELMTHSLSESSTEIRARVQQARHRQTQRFAGTKCITNSEMSHSVLKKWCVLDTESQALLERAITQFDLSARSYHRILKISRTIADLAGSDTITTEHLAEALQYRPKPLS
jgi:magnesium chelatase family protein